VHCRKTQDLRIHRLISSTITGIVSPSFAAFRHEYNDERPHEALGQTPPQLALRRVAAPVPVAPAGSRGPRTLPRQNGHDRRHLSFRQAVYIANALTNQRIGLEETDDGCWSVHFHRVLLATFDERDYIIQS
jgi:hypothetical protein